MAYKRQVDRLPIVPKDARQFNVVCHYCIVGCGYHAYTWPTNRQGGTAPDQNAFGADLSKQQPAETAAWYSPAMYNIVKQNGEDVHIVIKPDKDCVVNSGLGSVRGARIAEMSYSRQRNTQLQRLTDPMVWRYGQMQPTSWDDALDLVARVTKWRGLQAAGKQAEKDKWPFLINNGRTNVVRQNAYLDQDNEFVMDRTPYPLVQLNPADMTDLKLKQGDLVEIYNENGSTQAMVYPTTTAKPKQAFMLFANPNGVQGNVVSPGVNELIIPNYKQTWGAIRKLADAPEGVRDLSFKSLEYSV